MAGIPTRAQILEWVAENPDRAAKRDIARAFGVKGADRADLKRLLRELEEEGALERRRRAYRDPERLPSVSILEVLAQEEGGACVARPARWRGKGEAPRFRLARRASDPAFRPGDRVLARLPDAEGGGPRLARPIRRIGSGPERVLGVFRAGAGGGRIVPTGKGPGRAVRVAAGGGAGAREGELVEAERGGGSGARILRRLGDPWAPGAVSLIAVHEHGVPDAFPEDALAEAAAARPPGPEGREDLRGLPFVTIDPEDARDRDDACCARADPDPANPGGHVLWVAIADVAAQVRPGSALDREALRRGNSTYFPGRVAPMLPERLSGDLCSLHEGEDRACLAVEMALDADGRKLRHRFVRGLMRSAAALEYREAQAARDGSPSARCAPLMEDALAPLHAAHGALARARRARAPLDLELPEREIVLDGDGRVASVDFRERLDAHRMIEEFMVLANVAAAEELARRRAPVLYRVHEEPDPERMETLREAVAAGGLRLADGPADTRRLNALLGQAKGGAERELASLAVLRAMPQACYAADNLGHFGLALRAYAHFTSPIRRYADLVVHRALIGAHGWGGDGIGAEEADGLARVAQHVSATERRSMAAERDTADRYLAAFLAERVGGEFAGRISGVRRFGLFVTLEETGAVGLVPLRLLGAGFHRYDERSGTLADEDGGPALSIGLPVTVRLSEADPASGRLALELLGVEGGAPARRGRGRAAGGRRRGAGRRGRRT